MDPSYTRLLPADDPERLYYEEVRELFGGDDVLLLALISEEDIYRPEILDRVGRITRALEAHEGVERVISLATARDIRSTAGELRVVEFLEEAHDTEGQLARLRAQVANNPVFAEVLVSEDARATAIIVELLDTDDRIIVEQGIDTALLELARAEPGEGRIALTGGPHMRAAWTRGLETDLSRVIPLDLVLVLAIAWLVLRTLASVVVPLLTLLAALIWALGVLAWWGLELNPITVVVLPLVLVVGFAYVIHIISASSEVPGVGRERVERALVQVGLPVVLTAATTAAGFLALLASPLGAIREFGAFCALGIATTLVASLTLAPALQVLLDRGGERTPRAPMGEALLERLGQFDLRHRRGILAMGALVVCLSVWGATRLEVTTGLVTNLPEDHATRLDFQAVDERLQGAGLFSVVVEAGEAGAFQEPANLRRLEEIQTWLEEQPEISTTTSLADYVKLLHRGFLEDDPSALRIPDERALVSQLLLLGPAEDLEEYADFEYRTAHILVRSSVTDSKAIGALARRVRERLLELPRGLEGQVTGNIVLFSHALDLVAAGQATSLAWAFGMIFVILSVVFASVRMGAIALVPNALPIVVYYGAMGFSGTPLNLTTGVVACLVLGIAVDDTTHYMLNFNAEARRGGGESRGLVAALHRVGRPVTITSVALCLGFLVVGTAQMRSIAQFGVFASLTLAVAWIADLTFTPALSARMRIVTLWDLLTLDLGSEPHRTLPLFAGLRRDQAKIAALMMSVVRVKQGDHLMRLGDPGGELFVVLEGELAVSYPGAQGPTELRRLTRGDVVGEVGAFGRERSADVTATQAARLLSLSPADLARLRRRHPRIAAQVNENLIRVLSDRIVDLTERAART